MSSIVIFLDEIIKSKKSLTKYFFISLFFIIHSANTAPITPLEKNKIIASELLELETLANKQSLTLTEWMNFVNRIDQKCEVETEEKRLEAYCSFYYDISTLGEFLTEKKSTEFSKGCIEVENTAKINSSSDQIFANVQKVLRLLCPQK